MHVIQFKGYKDPELKLTLLKDIEDIQPYEVVLPTPPPVEEIDGYGLPYQEQKFQHVDIPKNVKLIEKITGKDQDETYDLRRAAVRTLPKDEKKFIEREWQRRINGYWFYNNGVPTFITGTHYFYCNYNKIDVGFPNYYDTDRRFWYFVDLICEPDENCYGSIIFTRRREGKTYKGGAFILEPLTRNKKWTAGIQSKTNKDGRKVFSKAIVNPWRSLPFYFSPKFDSSTYPRTELRFYATTETGKAAALKDLTDIDELGSEIDVRASVEEAYDGEKLQKYLRDEAGKTVEVNVYDGWQITKECFVVEGKLIGKAMITTTVEEMEKKGGANFKELWDESSMAPDDLMENGQTQSGLYPYFQPAYDGYVRDEYGNSLIEQAQEKLEQIRRGLIGTDALAAHKRKYPWSIREAFRAGINDCPFNVEIIETRLEDFHFGNPYVQTGNFHLSIPNDLESNVYWEASKKGRFQITCMIPEERRNLKKQIIYTDGKPHWAPENPEFGVLGADPFKYRVVKSKKKSQGAAHLYAGYDPFIDSPDKDEEEWLTDDFILEYCARPRTKQLYGMDMLMACIFYGVKCFPEINVPFLWDFFEEKGFGGYLLFPRDHNNKRSKTPGATTLGDRMKDTLFTHAEQYVEKNGHRCKFPRLLEQYLEVDYENLSPYDLFVSSTYSLAGVKQPVRKVRKKRHSKKFFKTYNWSK